MDVAVLTPSATPLTLKLKGSEICQSYDPTSKSIWIYIYSLKCYDNIPDNDWLTQCFMFTLG